jgi:serine/threonine-protein kinase
MASIYDYLPLFGGWKVAEKLGSGGFGEVYVASREQLGLKQYSAIKRIPIASNLSAADPKLLNRVKVEIALMLKMRGTGHVVDIEEFTIEPWKDGEGQDVLIRMELLECLESIIKKEVLSISEVIKLGIHMCMALELFDTHAIIHRDIRPPNIFRSVHGDYKLGDFGIARMATDGNAPSYASNDIYMAPEMLRTGGKYNKRADIYSLGFTLYFLLNKNSLHITTGTNEEMFLQKATVLPVLDNVPLWLMNVLQKSCSYMPNERYMNAKEMHMALEHGLKEGEFSNE